ncbi:hypothetical protein D0867_00295 [Hortaea werneckii]|uniref:Uncharacterized protein n=1 Tax=Hortaea werneckii TaxID=91943 RepID=A0A3M7AF38_HORWE|nr:hypothetical protein D0867_00295 [Hortaea werneckii]
MLININAWTARLMSSAHAKEADMPDMSLYCIWTLRMVLEIEEQPSNVSLSATAVWFIPAAPVAKPGSRSNDQERRGFTRDRWQTWMQRLSELDGQISDATTKQMVEQARRAMSDAVKR